MHSLLLLHTVLGVPSLIFYLFVLIFTRRRDKVFSGTFYLLMKYGGAVEIYTYVINMLSLNLMYFKEMVPFYHFLLKIPGNQYLVWLPIASFHALSFYTMSTTIYRLILLRNPLDGEQKVKKFVVPTLILIPIAAFLITGYIPFQHPYIICEKDSCSWMMDGGLLYFFVTVCFALSYAVIIALLSLASFLLMQQHRNMAKTMRRLFAISIFTNTIQVGFTVLMGLKSIPLFVGPEANAALQESLDLVWIPLMTFVACMSSPWIHLVFNKPFRENVKRTLSLS